MVSVGQSPRRLRARAAAWAQGARPAQRGRPRKSRRQRGQGPACRLPSPVSLFKAERGKDGEMEARGRGPRRGLVGRKWEPSALGRGWGEAPPLPGAGNESRPIAEPQGCLGRAGLGLVLGLPWERPKHSGQQSAPPRQGPKQTLGAGLEASRGPQGRAGPGLPVFRQGPGVGDRGGPPPPPGEPRGTRAGKHAQHREGSRTLTVPGDSKRTERPARSPPGAVRPRPRLWVSLWLPVSPSVPARPGVGFPPGKVPGENPRHPRPAPSESPSDSHVGCFPGCPIPGCRTMEAPLSPLWASSWWAHPHVMMQPETRATLSCL